jgi:hypothetical protein
LQRRPRLTQGCSAEEEEKNGPELIVLLSFGFREEIIYGTRCKFGVG